MKILEDIQIKDAIEIKAPPESVFEFLLNLNDDESYRNWHPEDHISLCWLKGKPWAIGSVVCAKEYIHGVKHTFRFVITKLIPNKRIEYIPTFWFYRIFFPKNSFIIEQTSTGCIFTAEGTYRIGRIGKILAKNKIEKGIASMKRHMREEGENLKRIVESSNP